MNGHTHIHLNGKKVDIFFGLESLMMIEERMKKTSKVPKVGGLYNIMALSYYAYAGYYNNCIIKELEDDLKYEDFYHEFQSKRNDELFANDIVKMMEVFSKSIGDFNAELKAPEEDQKKNQEPLIGKKSKKTVINSD